MIEPTNQIDDVTRVDVWEREAQIAALQDEQARLNERVDKLGEYLTSVWPMIVPATACLPLMRAQVLINCMQEDRKITPP